MLTRGLVEEIEGALYSLAVMACQATEGADFAFQGGCHKCSSTSNYMDGSGDCTALRRSTVALNTRKRA